MIQSVCVYQATVRSGARIYQGLLVMYNSEQESAFTTINDHKKGKCNEKGWLQPLEYPLHQTQGSDRGGDRGSTLGYL